MGVGIGRLRVRGAAAAAPRVAFMVADACRTEIPDTDRLILIRRLALDRRAVSAHAGARAAAMQAAWSAATLGARHGATADAAADCVWFHSAAEARRILFAMLLSGRAPSGWFWRKAAPDWNGRPWPEWLGARLARALDGAEDEAAVVLDMMRQALLAGAGETLAGIVAARVGAVCAPPAAAPTAAPVVAGAGPDNRAATDPHAPGAGSVAAPSSPPLRVEARSLRARLSPAMRAALALLIRAGGGGEPAVFRLVAGALLARAPSLSLSPGRLDALTRAYVAEELAARGADAGLRANARRHPMQPFAPSPALTEAPPAIGAVSARAPDRALRAPISIDPPAMDMDEAAPATLAPELAGETVSEAAGLWLVLPSLRRMGFREYLAARPELLDADPGRALLRLIARHYRVPADDPALHPLMDDDAGADVRAPHWAMLWRRGLDGWLRRRCGIPLAGLVWRRGALAVDDVRLIVRFPPEAADIRLRRHALDIDPGWTDWIGFSVRYRYAQRGAE